MLLIEERNAVVEYCRLMLSRGLTKGTGGNISIFNRAEGLAVISPSGVEYTDMRPEDTVVTDLTGKIAEGNLKPSSELMMHLCVYRERADANAVVHTHSSFATALACMRLELPAIHFLVGCAGADTVPCLPYYTFGSDMLAGAAAKRLGEQPGLWALLLANHGLLTAGPDIKNAFNTAEEIEFASELYYRALLLNRPIPLLSEEEMADSARRLASYGQK